MFRIRMGVPDMELFWDDLLSRKKQGSLGKKEQQFFRKFAKALRFLSANPRHPGLATHEIMPLTKRYQHKVFQSYLENRTPSAGRIFWVYGPDKAEITIIGLEPHPDDGKRGAYDKVRLSDLPP